MGKKKIIECTKCGYKGKGKKFGSQPKQIILRTIFWFLFLIPGFIYDEIIANRWVCPKCKTDVYPD